MIEVFEARDKHLKLLTSISVHGWTYMAKWHNSNVRLHSLARKRFHFHKLLACNTSLWKGF